MSEYDDHDLVHQSSINCYYHHSAKSLHLHQDLFESKNRTDLIKLVIECILSALRLDVAIHFKTRNDSEMNDIEDFLFKLSKRSNMSISSLNDSLQALNINLVSDDDRWTIPSPLSLETAQNDEPLDCEEILMSETATTALEGIKRLKKMSQDERKTRTKATKETAVTDLDEERIEQEKLHRREFLEKLSNVTIIASDTHDSKVIDKDTILGPATSENHKRVSDEMNIVHDDNETRVYPKQSGMNDSKTSTQFPTRPSYRSDGNVSNQIMKHVTTIDRSVLEIDPAISSLLTDRIISQELPSDGSIVPFQNEYSGRIGEYIAFEYLKSKMSEAFRITWLNQNDEEGLPYDILIEDRSNVVIKKYCEVKTRVADVVHDEQRSISQGRRHMTQWFISPKEIAEAERLQSQYFCILIGLERVVHQGKVTVHPISMEIVGYDQGLSAALTAKEVNLLLQYLPL